MELNIYDKYLTINQTNTTKDLYSNCFGLRKQIIMPNYGRNSSLDLRDVKSSPYSHSQEDGRIEKQQSSFTDLKTKNTSVVDTIFGFGALPCSENLAKPFSTYKKNTQDINNSPSEEYPSKKPPSSLSELLLRQPKDISQQYWPTLQQETVCLEDEMLRNRNELFSCIYNQQKCSDQQILATQLFYARLFQTQQLPESDKTINKAFPGLAKKTIIRQEDLPPTPSSQDNNNNNELLGGDGDENSLRCEDQPFFDNRTQNNMQDNNVHIDENVKTVADNKYVESYDLQHSCQFIREHKNILNEIKTKLEQLSLISGKFRNNLGNINENDKNNTNSALETTVRRQLSDNCKTIDTILDQVKRLYNKWSSSELYYQRSLQRLGLSSSEEESPTTTHTIMALAAIALSEESEESAGNKIKPIDLKKPENKPKTLNEIENIILKLASAINTHNLYGNDNIKSDGEDLMSATTSPNCIWHTKKRNFLNSNNKEDVKHCTTAAEIILEYASLSSSASSCKKTIENDRVLTTKSPPNLFNNNNRESRSSSAVSTTSDHPVFLNGISSSSSTPLKSYSTEIISSIFGLSQDRRKAKLARLVETPTDLTEPTNLTTNSDQDSYKLEASNANTIDKLSAITKPSSIRESCTNNIFKARLCINNDGEIAGSINESEILPMLDAPFDLSTKYHGTKLKNINLETKNASTNQSNESSKEISNDKKKPHIKKPLNAFMLYMKEMRAKVVAECTLKESAAINQILGRRWHELSREEQSKYYEKARQERQLHMELYPGWSARDNYGYVSKKKKRKKDRSTTDSGGNNMKKCRARFGLDQQNQWCKPCSPNLGPISTVSNNNNGGGMSITTSSNSSPGVGVGVVNMLAPIVSGIVGGTISSSSSSSSSSTSSSHTHVQLMMAAPNSSNGSGSLNGIQIAACSQQLSPQQQTQAPPTYVNLRKKKCIRYMEAMNGNCGVLEDGSGMDDHGSDDDDDDDDDDVKLNGSCGSVDADETTNKIGDDDAESLDHGSMSSFAQSPSTTTTSLASPLNMINFINPTTPNPAALLINVNATEQQQRSTSVSTSSTSAASSGSGGTTPSTSSTVSPVTTGIPGVSSSIPGVNSIPGGSGTSSTLAERAMLLGNRFSHLGMGLSPVFTTTTTAGTGTNKLEPFFGNNISLNNLNNSPIPIPILPNIIRNPIGANPRDINNPLSINQLTNHHQPSSLLKSSFSQHFQHQHQFISTHMMETMTTTTAVDNRNEATANKSSAAECLNNHERITDHHQQSNASSKPPSSAGASETGAISVS